MIMTSLHIAIGDNDHNTDSESNIEDEEESPSDFEGLFVVVKEGS